MERTINLLKFRGNDSPSFTGRPEGQSARKIAGIDKMDDDKNTYQFLIPRGTTAFNPSFFLGFFFQSIKKLGFEKFESKYQLLIEDEMPENEIRLLRDIEEGKRHAKNQLDVKSGFFSFLNI